ncbi:MAG: hypothetical protein R3F61_02930 [Myxococcota bacterium]
MSRFALVQLLTLGSVLAVSTGCAIPAAVLLVDALDRDPSYVDTGSWDDWDDEASEQWVASGQMRGQTPPTGAFDRDITSGTITRSTGWTDFEVNATGGDWAMLAGGFETDRLVDGRTITLDPSEHWIYGCSGPSEWNAEFDEPADTVQVRRDRIEIAGEPLIELTITATFGPGSEIVTVVSHGDPDGNG